MSKIYFFQSRILIYQLKDPCHVRVNLPSYLSLSMDVKYASLRDEAFETYTNHYSHHISAERACSRPGKGQINYFEPPSKEHPASLRISFSEAENKIP